MVKTIRDVEKALNGEELISVRLINESEVRINSLFAQAIRCPQSFQECREQIQKHEQIIQNERQRLEWLHDLMVNVLFDEDEPQHESLTVIADYE